MIIVNFVFALNLTLLAADHLFTGTLALFFPKKAVRAFNALFGAHIPATKEYFVILKPWGALGVFAGLVGMLPAFDSERYALILWFLLALLMMRLFYRLKFQREAESSINLSKKRNLFHVGLIAVCASIIALQVLFM